jgi:single-stranded DNA-binding protein
MSAREYLNETGLASLWAKIVNKINALGDLCVKKAGDTMTGALYMHNTRVVCNATSFDQGTLPASDRTYTFGTLRDKNNNNVMKFGVNHKSTTGNIEATVSTTKLKSGVSTVNEFTIGVDENSNKYEKVEGRLIVPSVGGMWVQGRDATKNAINIDGQANNGQSYDGILWTKCYNGNIINVGRITNELDIAYIESGQTDNALRKYIKFAPAEDKVKFGTSGADKSYINLSNGGFYGNWNGTTDDHNTNNTTDTWVPVYNGSKMQHRVMSAQLNTYITGDGYSGCCSAKNCDTVTYIKCIRIGQLVICNFALAFNSERTGEVAWVALNSNFRPARTLYFNVNIAGNSAANTNESAHRMYIYPDGTLKMWIDNTNAKVTQTFGEISFCTF